MEKMPTHIKNSYPKIAINGNMFHEMDFMPHSHISNFEAQITLKCNIYENLKILNIFRNN